MHRQNRGGIQRALRNVDDEGDHADHQKRRRFAQCLGHADDGSGQDARHGERQDVVGDDLQRRSAKTVSGLTDRRRHRFQGRAGGDDDCRQGHQGEHQTADQGGRAGHAEEVDEHRQTQQAEHDGRNRRQVVDVDLDGLGPFVDRGEFFQIDRRRDGQREGHQQRHQHGEQRAHGRPADTRQFRLAAVAGGEERGVEYRFHQTPVLQPFEPGDLLVLHPAFGLGKGAVDLAFVQLVDIVRQRHLNGQAFADQIRVFEHLVADFVHGAGADHFEQLTLVAARGDVREQVEESLADDRAVIGPRQNLRVACAVGIDVLRVQRDFQVDHRLGEGGDRLADDRREQQAQHADGEDDRQDAVHLEPFLGRVAALQALAHGFAGIAGRKTPAGVAVHGGGRVSHIALDIC